MITIRKSEDRGRIDHGWLDARHTFSFARYIDPDWNGFRGLRVINEDTIAPRRGFGEHPHRDMEIVTYPVSGAVRHTDSLGHKEDITPGMIQRMSAGSGIRHAEMNPLNDPTHLLQIWIEPRELGTPPSHESVQTKVHTERNTLHTLVSEDGRDGSLVMGADARMSAGRFDPNTETTIETDPGRHLWIQLVRGSLTLNNEHRLRAGDGAAISNTERTTLAFTDDTEVLVFDLA